MEKKRKYVISLIVFSMLLVISAITMAANIQTTSSKVTLNKVSKDEFSVAVKPEENMGVTSFQVFLQLKEEKTGMFNNNEIQDIKMEWNPNWRIEGVSSSGMMDIELAKAEFDKKTGRIYMYVVSKTELVEEGMVTIGTLKIITKNDKEMMVKITPIQSQTYIVSPENASRSLQVLIDESTDGISLEMGVAQVPEENVNTNTNTNENTNTNTNSNTENTNNTSNSVTNDNTNIVNNISNNTVIENTIQNETTINQVIQNNTIENGIGSTTNTTQNDVKDNLPKTGITEIGIIAAIVVVASILGIGHSVYRLKKKE